MVREIASQGAYRKLVDHFRVDREKDRLEETIENRLGIPTRTI